MNKAAIVTAAVIAIVICAYVASMAGSGDSEEETWAEPEEFSLGSAAIVDGDGNTLLYSRVISSGGLTVTETAYLCANVTVSEGATLTINLKADLVLTGEILLSGSGSVKVVSSDGATIVTGSSGEGYAEVSGGFDDPYLYIQTDLEFVGVEFRDEGSGSYRAILTRSDSLTVFEDCVFSDMEDIVVVEGKGYVEFTDCTFADCTFYDWEGMLILHKDAVFSGCTFSGCLGQIKDEEGYYLALVVCEGESEFNDCVFKDGDGQGSATIYAEGYAEFNGCTADLESHVWFEGHGDMAFLDCTISVEDGDEDWTAVYCSGNLTVSGCTFSGFNGYCGGAIYCINEASVTRSTFTDCHASQSGGALYVLYGDAFLTDCVFDGCIAEGNGGAVSVSGCMYATGCTFRNCETEANGGAVWVYVGGGVMDSCTFESCVAAGTGCAVYMFMSTDATITGCTFIGCGSDEEAVSGYNYAATVTDCTFSDRRQSD